MSEDKPSPSDGSTSMEELMKLMKLQIETTLQTATMKSHGMKHHVKAPEGRYEMKSSEFRIYSKDYHDFKHLTKLADEDIVIQMRLNMDEELKRAVDTNYGQEWNSFSLDKALSSVKELMKSTSNTAIYRKEFDSLDQKNGESVREYITRLKACALDCEFLCPFDNTHDLTEYHIVNRIRCGIQDKQLQQELLQKKTMTSLNEVIIYCENFESSKLDRDRLRSKDYSEVSALVSEGLSNEEMIAALSTYKKQKQQKLNNANCFYCGYDKHEKSKCPAQGKRCAKCNGLNHFATACRTKNIRTHQKAEGSESSAVIISTVQKIDEHMTASASKIPFIDIEIGATENKNTICMRAVADTGAQVCVAGVEQMMLLGIKKSQLKKPTQDLRHVGGNTLNVFGSHNVCICLNDTTIKTDLYFVKGIKHIYLSLDVCKMVHIIPENFPLEFVQSKVAATIINESVNEAQVEYCDEHSLNVSEGPEKPPFPCTEENVTLLQDWFLHEFKDTVFNVNAEPLPVMKGAPHKIHLKENAIPYAAHTPIPIPHHWKDEVKNQLDKDEQLGIIRKAPVGKSSEWCMRMVVVPKSNGQPRRTIDFQPINKFCLRETHFVPTPFNAVNSIPRQVYKTSLDAFNGYHQVALEEESIELTSFITEFGRYQYLRAPQGHMASGDAYVRRFDDIISHVERKQKVVDDVLLYGDSITKEFYHTFDFLVLCAANGITFNPEKFRFAQKELDFVGFNVGWDSYRPSENTMHAIKNFPMPPEPTLADIRSWFGLVNQLAPFIASSTLMAPFRELLKSSRANGNKIYWDEVLQNIFEETKVKLCDLITEGLTYYDVKRKTVVITDWSKTGIGFVILQKHCKCKDLTTQSTLCCQVGWKPIFCNSRHTDERELNYRPIEGEALAVEWALRKGKMFLLGNENFEVLTDHKPLLKIFGDKPLHEIENPILQKLKERIMPYSYTMRYIKGIKNHANVLSRYPAVTPNDEDFSLSKDISSVTISAVERETEKISITRNEIIEKGSQDEQYVLLQKTLKNSTFAANKCDEMPLLKEFHSVRDRLSITDNMITYSFENKPTRILIPRSLRKKAIDNLHSANQGSTSMLSRVRESIYWPGIDNDVDMHCQTCMQCRANAPSKQKEPMIPSDIPDYPFQKVATDMFELNDYWYLAYVDRLTGFPELAYFPRDTTSALIINVLREFFQRWGVPEEISMDGAPNYTSHEITNWLSSWGVTHTRVSSAYYPQSNGRAEISVKSLKRLLEGNTGPRGSISNDNVAKALMQLRNTPHRDGSGSPAELALGRCIRDTLPLPQHRYKINPNWARSLHEREIYMQKQSQHIKQKYDEKAKTLKPLVVGDSVLSQNVRTKKWDKSGVIMEIKGFRQYLVKMDGSGRLSLRNRRHLQKVHELGIGSPDLSSGIVQKNVSENEGIRSPDPSSGIVQDNIGENEGITGGVNECEELLPVVPPTELRRSMRQKKPTQRYIAEC